MVSLRPSTALPGGKTAITIPLEAGGLLERLCTIGRREKSLAFDGIRIPDRRVYNLVTILATLYLLPNLSSRVLSLSVKIQVTGRSVISTVISGTLPDGQHPKS
jgi:hypothetical protein